MFTFTFYELELSSGRSIRFGMRDAKNRNYESKHCCCCLHPPRTFFEGGNPPLQKRSNASSDSHPSSGKRKAQWGKRGEGVHPPPTLSQFCLLPRSFLQTNRHPSPSSSWHTVNLFFMSRPRLMGSSRPQSMGSISIPDGQLSRPQSMGSISIPVSISQ
jgi:hypothetical protein